MNGINVKKIAAFAGAAVLLGASLAVADVVYGNTQLVDQNGQPTVKVVVGSHAAISDGVAAANIAAKIANEAYKSSTLTAAVSGTPTCKVGNGTSGTGACSIVESSKKVTLEVTLPGEVAGTYTFKTLVTDSIDRLLANRVGTGADDTWTNTNDQSTFTSPLRSSQASPTTTALYRIGSDDFSGFQDYPVVDDQAVSSSYTEQQSFWVGTQPNAIVWDQQYHDVVVNQYSALAYSAKFTGTDYGIPVCTGGTDNTNDTTYWAGCDSSGNDRTDKHRVGIKFLAGNWIISSMSNPTSNLSSSTNVANGGTVKLAKEAKYGIVNVGGILDAGTFQIRLSDISVATGQTNLHPAILDVLDPATQAVISQIQVNPGTTYTYTQPGTGNSVKIHVYNTAPGFTLNAKWAEMAVYTDEVTLQDNAIYNLQSSSDNNWKDFKVSLLWKNRDYTSGLTGTGTYPDSLREIVVYQTQDLTDKIQAGGVYNFLKVNPAFTLTYQGLDLQDSDYSSLSITAPSSSTTYQVAATAGGSATCDGYMTWTSPVIRVQADNNLFGGTGNLIDDGSMVSELLFDPHVLNTVGASPTALPNGTNLYYTASSGNQSSAAKILFWKEPSKSCYNWNVYTGQASLPTAGSAVATSKMVRFDTAGDNSAAPGGIYFVANNTVAAGYEGFVVMQEDAGKVNSTSDYPVSLAVSYNSTADSNSVRFRQDSSNTQNVFYQGVPQSGTADSFHSKEVTFVTERGSKATSVTTTSATIEAAEKIGMPSFQFALSSAAANSSTANTYQLGVGDSKVFGGVTVKVDSIDATAGSCSVLGPGGAPACTVDSSGLSAVIQPNNAGSVTVTQPVALSSNLVVLDSNAAGVGAVISVGGPDVNTVTAAAVQGANVDFSTKPVIKEIGNVIVVAGQTAQDTMTAADQFISAVQRQ